MSLQHKEATEKELYRERCSKDGGIAQALQIQVSLNISTVKVAMQCIYWLVKSGMTHMFIYGSMLETVKFMGYNKLSHLYNEENASYRITQEFLFCFFKFWVINLKYKT